jgi:uncharacterized protein (TIGR02145 family)
MPVNICEAVDMIPGLTYTFYENPDKTDVISGCTVSYNPPKNTYYVSANNGECEGPLSPIILNDPCPPDTADVEGNRYKVTSLAGLCWTENLRSTLYTCNEEPITFAKTYTCAGCPEQLDTIFGLLYDWYSAMGMTDPDDEPDPACICPEGFRIPTAAEWELLSVGANNHSPILASQLKSKKYWLAPPGPGTDDYGFDARPAGWYNGIAERFEDLYGFTGWWASDLSPENTTTASYFYISYYCNNILQEVKKKGDGLSVRCVMDY